MTSLAHGTVGAVRLAITDPSGSNQPLLSNDHQVALVFNGEIFNFEDERRRLAAKGCRFSTAGDGEVVLQQYLLDPEQLPAFDGMYAYAIIDQRRRRLVLARDPFGVKPLYWWRRDSAVGFSSELKGAIVFEPQSNSIDDRAVRDYANFRFCLPPHTPLSGVMKVEPGAVMRIDSASLEVSARGAQDVGNGTTSHTLHSALSEAVASAAAAQRSPAILLSGGIDSASVAALVPATARPVCYTAVYLDAVGAFNEHSDAGACARDLGLAHETVPLRHRDVPVLFDRVLQYLDEPILSPICLSTLALFRRISSAHNVALTGDGSDELFDGYPRMRAIPGHPLRLDDYIAQLGWVEPEWEACVPGLVDSEWASERLRDVTPASTTTGVIRSFERRVKLPEYHLARVDRLSMAYGVEARPPFLRASVASTLDPVYVARSGDHELEKDQLRSAVRTLLPASVVGRSKKSFSAPVQEWTRVLRSRLLDYSASPQICASCGVDGKQLSRIIESGRARSSSDSKSEWGLLTLLAWRQAISDRLSSARAENALWQT